nr:hypothetical protein [Tanacetum cinerariifolium]
MMGRVGPTDVSPTFGMLTIQRVNRDNVQLETAVNTITHEYLLEFTSEYGILEALRPELPGPGDRIVDFPEGKVGVYTSQAMEAVVEEPPTVRESRKRGPEGVDANAP